MSLQACIPMWPPDSITQRSTGRTGVNRILFTAVLPITTIRVTPTLGQVSVCSSRLCRTAGLRTYLNNIPCFVCSRYYLYSAPFGHFLFPTLPTSGQFFYASPKKWPPDSITQRSTGRTGVNRILYLDTQANTTE